MVYRSCLTDRRLELGCQGDAAHLLVSGAMGSFPSFRKSETRNVNSPGPDFPFPAIHLNFGGCSVFCCKHSKRAIIFVCEPWICAIAGSSAPLFNALDECENLRGIQFHLMYGNRNSSRNEIIRFRLAQTSRQIRHPTVDHHGIAPVREVGD